MTFDDLVDDEEGEDGTDEDADGDDDGDDDEDDDEEDGRGVAVAASVAAVAGVEAGAAVVAQDETSVTTTSVVRVIIVRVITTPEAQAVSRTPVSIRVIVISTPVIARSAPYPPAITAREIIVTVALGVVYSFEATGNATSAYTDHKEEDYESPKPYPAIPNILII